MNENIRKILPYALVYKKNIFGNVFFNVLYALFGTIGMVFIFPVIKVLFNSEEKVTQMPVYEGIGTLDKYLNQTLFYYINYFSETYGANYSLLLTVGLVIVTFLLKNVFGYFGAQHLTRLKSGVLRDLRTNMYQKIVSLPISFYSEKRKGDTMARMLGDLSEVQNSFFAILELIVKEPLTILFSLIAMFKISWKLTLFVLLFIPLSALIISKIGKSLKATSSSTQKENGFLISIVEETLGGLKIVKSFNAENYFTRIFTNSANKIFSLTMDFAKKYNLASPLSEFLGILVITILLLYGGNLVLVEKTLDGSLFIAYIALAYNILTPAKAISKASYQVKTGTAAADRVFEILETKNTITNNSKAKKINLFKHSIAIENISFNYNEDQNAALKNFSLTIEKGKTVALVGQSGSGKSTLANLLTRFYDVTNGTISIDNHNIRDIELKSLRDLIGLVSQDHTMFNGSIAENLRIGKENATEQEIINALKVAHAFEFVEKLPKGIHSNIGDSGSKLSGGQKQRLSIARAVLKNPPIMILDEATSALDTQSEKFVQDALEHMMQNRTSIVIAHRLSTIQKADCIVVMQQGEIAEQGTHQELILKKGIYSKLVELQKFD